MKRLSAALLAGLAAGAFSFGPSRLAAQAGGDLIAAIEAEGTGNSQVASLAQVLLDSIGPRLTGTPGMRAAQDWALRTYEGWGIEARNEEYGRWADWRRGI